MEQLHASSRPPERFVVEVSSELPHELVRARARDVNVILRMSMLTGVQMHLDAALALICDQAGEIVRFERALAYFWEDSSESAQLRLARGIEGRVCERMASGNILNCWATRYGRPLIVTPGHNPEADDFLDHMRCGAAIVVPLLVNNRVLGTLQLLALAPDAFTEVDAQLLWVLALVSENLLTREHSNEGLLRFAFTDFLTGLKTRGFFEQQLELELKRAERKRQPLSLLMVDIDHFKRLNDNYGHHVGDQVLRDVSSLLMKDMREVDTVARYGGEEFVLVLPETNGPGAQLVAERLRNAVEQSRFFAGSARAVERLTISIGIAVCENEANYKRDLIDRADRALYAAKDVGRNRVVLYSDVDDKPVGPKFVPTRHAPAITTSLPHVTSAPLPRAHKPGRAT